VQFALIFHLLCHGRTMIDYIAMQKLFVQLNVPNNLMKHWSNGAGWEMTDSMCEQVFKKTQNFMVARRFFSLSVNEVATILYIKATVVSVCLSGQCPENSSSHNFPDVIHSREKRSQGQSDFLRSSPRCNFPRCN